MVSRPKILLISQISDLHYDTLLRNGGFEVVTAENFTEGLTHWKPVHFSLVLVVVNDDLEQPMAFCDELKKLDPNQSVAFVTGWRTYVPPSHCPDEVIERDHNPGLFVKKVTELSQAR